MVISRTWSYQSNKIISRPPQSRETIPLKQENELYSRYAMFIYCTVV
jgi:hypothetical protein